MTTENQGDPPTVALGMRDRVLRERLVDLLRRAEVRVEALSPDEERWWERAARSDADVLVLRRAQLESEEAREALDQLAERESGPEIVVVSDDEDPVERAELMASGAANVLDAGFSDGEMRNALETVATALAERGTARPETGGSQAEPRLADFLSRSSRMRSFVDMVERIKESDSSLLIVGETGVGKEHLARAIHAESARASKPFVSVNCGAIPEHLLESELFGHEKGAFTGAAGSRQGRFQQADGGTIFLDEIGDLPKQHQVDLLTVLQRREVRPLGASKPQTIDVRVMAATNSDLVADVEAGRFREDLYYRLDVIRLEIPPLRERREDIPGLVGSFMRHFRTNLEREDILQIDPDAVEALLRYEWPGNIRELINVVERAMLLCRGTTLGLADLPEPLGSLPVRAGSADALALPRGWAERPFREVSDEVGARFERRYFTRLLERTEGRVGESAKLAGISERTLYEKMKRLGLRKEDYRS